MPSASFDEVGKKFSGAAQQWGALAQRSAQAQGNEAAAATIGALTEVFQALVGRLTNLLKTTFEDFNPFPNPDPLSAFLDAAIDEVLDGINAILGNLASGSAAILDAAVGSVLGLFEVLKKAIHLVLDRVKLPNITGPIETVLDLINNIIGNIAELVSAAAGRLAGKFRMNMYEQLAAIRAAEGAKPQAFVDDDTSDGR